MKIVITNKKLYFYDHPSKYNSEIFSEGDKTKKI